MHEKTHGNIFFVIQFLKSIKDSGLLTFNFGLLKWKWDLVGIRELYATDNVADLMIETMRRVPDEQCQILSVSSCLGSSFDLPVLILVIDFLQAAFQNDSRLSFIKKLTIDIVQPSIEEDLSAGLLELASTLKSDSFRFTHDQIKDAAAKLIPEESRDILQWHIGQALVNSKCSTAFAILSCLFVPFANVFASLVFV